MLLGLFKKLTLFGGGNNIWHSFISIWYQFIH